MPKPSSFEERLLKWLDRNGLYVGILAALIIFSLVVSGGFGLLYFYNQAIKTTSIFRETLADVKQSDAVRKTLGHHLREGWYISGNIVYEGTNGSADFQFPITGEKGWGNVQAKATRRNGIWDIQSLEFEKDGQKVSLLPDKKP